ncbi:MAG: hypothetical protein K2I72_01250 [Bacilli bacterium]|nr:hypothetical protein [Bacilli bacterium]
MATELQIKEWNQYASRQRELFSYGYDQGLIYPYEKDTDFMERLRHVYWGGMSLSVIVLCERMTNGFCYDRSFLSTYGFGNDDFKRVYAITDGIRLRPDYIDEWQEYSEEEKEQRRYGEHCYMERIKEDGTVWVYEPAFGLVYREDIYEEIEHPKGRKTMSREEVLSSYQYLDILSEDIEVSKYASIHLVPVYEACLAVGQQFHMDALREELELYKKKINYDEVRREEYQNIKKFGIFS